MVHHLDHGIRPGTLGVDRHLARLVGPADPHGRLAVGRPQNGRRNEAVEVIVIAEHIGILVTEAGREAQSPTCVVQYEYSPFAVLVGSGDGPILGNHPIQDRQLCGRHDAGRPIGWFQLVLQFGEKAGGSAQQDEPRAAADLLGQLAAHLLRHQLRLESAEDHAVVCRAELVGHLEQHVGLILPRVAVDVVGAVQVERAGVQQAVRRRDGNGLILHVEPLGQFDRLALFPSRGDHQQSNRAAGQRLDPRDVRRDHRVGHLVERRRPAPDLGRLGKLFHARRRDPSRRNGARQPIGFGHQSQVVDDGGAGLDEVATDGRRFVLGREVPHAQRDLAAARLAPERGAHVVGPQADDGGIEFVGHVDYAARAGRRLHRLQQFVVQQRPTLLGLVQHHAGRRLDVA